MKFLKLFRIKNIILILLIMLNIALIFFIKPIKVEGTSMYPTYENNQYGFTIKYAPVAKQLERFDVAILNHNGQKWVKRLIGMPGETIEYIDDVLYVNGAMMEEPFIKTEHFTSYKNDTGKLFTDNFSITLKEGEYLFLGDNRPYSLDSRRVGPFTLDDVVAKNLYAILDKDGLIIHR